MSLSPQAKPSRPMQIVVLWIVFLLGTLFHTQLGLMPLFHGLDVLAAHGHMATNLDEISTVLWLMWAFFTVPLVVLVATCFTDSRRYRATHLGITLVYSVLNLSHLLVDLMVRPIEWYQVALMALLFGVGLLLNAVAYQWWREVRPRQRLQSAH